MRIFLIDFENTKSSGLMGIETLEEDDIIYLFYSNNVDSITLEAHMNIVASKATFVPIKLDRPGKNALDFQLVTYLGYLIGTKNYGEYYIVSRDYGFQHAINFCMNYLKVESVLAKRVDSIEQGLIIKNLVINNESSQELVLKKPHKKEYIKNRHDKNNIVSEVSSELENDVINNELSDEDFLDNEFTDIKLEDNKLEDMGMLKPDLLYKELTDKNIKNKSIVNENEFKDLNTTRGNIVNDKTQKGNKYIKKDNKLLEKVNKTTPKLNKDINIDIDNIEKENSNVVKGNAILEKEQLIPKKEIKITKKENEITENEYKIVVKENDNMDKENEDIQKNSNDFVKSEQDILMDDLSIPKKIIAQVYDTVQYEKYGERTARLFQKAESKQAFYRSMTKAFGANAGRELYTLLKKEYDHYKNKTI